jgi:hypothetical protein
MKVAVTAPHVTGPDPPPEQRLDAAEGRLRARRQFLDRRRAAEFLGISTHKLKRLQTAGQAPVGIKRGDAKQARVVWPLEELVAYRADPAAYLAARAMASGGAFA